jgi:hypothetical protein
MVTANKVTNKNSVSFKKSRTAMNGVRNTSALPVVIKKTKPI